jgi:hypothetical protein
MQDKKQLGNSATLTILIVEVAEIIQTPQDQLSKSITKVYAFVIELNNCIN